MRNSWLLCPRDHKRLVVDQAEEEGQTLVTHRCLECPYVERAPADRPLRTDKPSYLAALRERAWAP